MIDKQLEGASDNINECREYLNEVMEWQDKLEAKREKLKEDIARLQQEITPDDPIRAELDHYKSVIKHLQDKLATGLPVDNAKDRNFVYNVVYHGIASDGENSAEAQEEGTKSDDVDETSR